jgi:hypothetical protein
MAALEKGGNLCTAENLEEPLFQGGGDSGGSQASLNTYQPLRLSKSSQDACPTKLEFYKILIPKTWPKRWEKPKKSAVSQLYAPGGYCISWLGWLN